MKELKQHQPPMTIDEQVENLKTLGLVINDEEYAKRILNDISYFRLIKAYSLGYKPHGAFKLQYISESNFYRPLCDSHPYHDSCY